MTAAIRCKALLDPSDAERDVFERIGRALVA
jgi:hypothetical protein